MVDDAPSLAGDALALRHRRRRRLPDLIGATPRPSVVLLDADGTERHITQTEQSGGDIMAWTTPIIVEICASFEVTAYAPAEM
jgi:coenzyme PQQ precursor peptide PqqA